MTRPPGGRSWRRKTRASVYRVEPTGPSEDDPERTDKKLSGNPTRSDRTRDPLRVVEAINE